MEREPRKMRVPRTKPEPAYQTVLRNPDVEFPTVEHFMPTYEEHIVWLQERQTQMERMSKNSEYAEIKIRSDNPVGIALTSDWHIGSVETDYKTFNKHQEIIKNDPNLFEVALSNTIDGYIWPGGMMSEVAHVPEQIDIAKKFAKEWKGKILAVVGSRCHDWSKDKGLISAQELAFMENVDEGMPFFQSGGLLTIDLNGIKYKVGMQHKSRFNSALNVTNANKRTLDLRWPSADVVAIAHHHVASIEHTARWEGPDKRDVVLVRTGTYKIDDQYGRSEGFGNGQLGAPMIVLDNKTKHITPFLHLEDGAEFVRLKKR
jgi:hypothetical protein